MPDQATEARDRASAEQEFANLIEEIAQRIQHEESVDLALYLQDHPQYAQQLRQVFPAMRILADLAASADEGDVGGNGRDSDALDAPGVLGDYRIVGELGRGGMGVVYEAEQVSLKRRVALKVLPFAAVLDQRQLQRFKNEAQAAASLKHPNIVHVYSVGCERGVHYYAMEYIEGQTLAQAIDELKRSEEGRDTEEEANRKRTTIDSAEPSPSAAPSHPLSSRDGQKKRSSLSSSGSTRRPEFFRTVAQLGIQAAQALEHAHQLGVVHRDIKPSNLMVDASGHLWVADFGLAMTQTETNLTMTGDVLGTLRYMSPEQAAGKSRALDHHTDIYSLGATLYELLTLGPVFEGANRQQLARRIAEEEPRAPRRANYSIPRDLETIVLKSIAKEQDRRYANAQEMADDLRRFLEHKPIRAKTPSLAHRTAKWLRRHRGWSIAGALALMLALMGLAVSNVLISRQREEANRQRIRAEDNLDRALEAVDSLLAHVANDVLLNQPSMEETRRQLLEESRELCMSLLDENSEAAAARRRTAEAQHDIGRINSLLGDYKEAEKAYRNAINLRAALTDELPDVAQHRFGLAESHSSLGGVLRVTGRLAEAKIHCRKSVEIGEKLVEDEPNTGDYQNSLGLYYERLGAVLDFTHQREQAELAYKRAMGIHEKAVDAFPRVKAYQESLASAYDSFGMFLANDEEAQRYHRMQIGILKRLLESERDNLKYRDRLSAGYANLAFDQGYTTEAEQNFRSAIEIQETLCRDSPGVPLYRSNLAGCYGGLGKCLEKTGRPEEGEPYFRKAIEISASLTTEYPDRPHLQYLFILEAFCNDLGLLLERAHRPHEAEEFYRKAAATAKKLVAASPDAPRYKSHLAGWYGNLARLLARDNNRLAESESMAREAIKITTQLATDFPDDETYRSHRLRNELDYALRAQGKLDEAEKNRREAIELWRDSAADAPGESDYAIFKLVAQDRLALLLKETDRFDEAESLFRENLTALLDLPDESRARAAQDILSYRDPIVLRAPVQGDSTTIKPAGNASRDSDTSSAPGSDAEKSLEQALGRECLQAMPTIVAPRWRLTRVVMFRNAQGAHYNPRDGCLYVARWQKSFGDGIHGGIYRIDVHGKSTKIDDAYWVATVAVDREDGDVFYSDYYDGDIFRIQFGGNSRRTWVSKFKSKDSDPIGMAFVGSAGAVGGFRPGDAIVVDRGDRGADEIYRFSADRPEGEVLLHSDEIDEGPLVNPVDVTVGKSGVFIVDTGLDDPGAIFQLQSDGKLQIVETSQPLTDPLGITTDSAAGSLLVLDDTRLVSINPTTGKVSELVEGLSRSFWAGVDITPDGTRIFVTGQNVIFTFAAVEEHSMQEHDQDDRDSDRKGNGRIAENPITSHKEGGRDD